MREENPRLADYFGGAGVNTSRLWLGSGFGFGFGAFLASFLPLSLLPMGDSVPYFGWPGKCLAVVRSRLRGFRD